MSISQDSAAASLPEQQGPKRHVLRSILFIIGGLLVVALILVWAYAFSLTSTFDSAKKIEKSFPAEEFRLAATNPSQNILLIGSDTGPSVADASVAQGTDSDTMIVVHVSADRRSIHVVSIMRDSLVDIPGHGKDKLSAALESGGVPLAVQTVEGLIGARVSRVAIVDYEGFKGITDALGGVEIDNPAAFASSKMPGKTFELGVNSLDGDDALAFVRERERLSGGDLQRTQNQQIYLKGMLNRILSAETLTNPVTVNKLVASITPYLTVDSGFTSGYAVGLALELRDIRMKDVFFFTMPTSGTVAQGDRSVVDLDAEQVALIKQHFMDDTLAAYEPPPQIASR